MLRDFERATWPTLLEVLSRFKIDLPEEVYLLKFQVLTPDSFIWRLLIGKTVYYLYAENFIDSLSQIESFFTDYLQATKWELIKAKDPLKFSESGPVKASIAYKEPGNLEELMRYTVDSGYDFIFLAKNNEDSNSARFPN